MMEFPRISVIVPVYNAQETLRDCVHSLLELNYPRDKLEIILIDNASTDETAEIAKQYSLDIQILYEAKRGPAATRNRGILNAKGEIIAFTDSDCVVDRDWLRNLVPALKEHRVGIAGGRILSRRPCNTIEQFGEEIHDHGKAIDVYKPPYVISMNWMSRRAVITEVGLFDESFIRNEDVDLSHRIFQAGYGFVHEPRAIVYHANERTLSGLFREGYLHGFYSVRTNRVHREFVKRFGHRSIDLSSYTKILSSLIDFLLRRNHNHAICYFVFNSGKKMGKLVGSVRFLHLDL